MKIKVLFLQQLKLCAVMKKVLFALLLAAGAVSCATKENYENQVGNPDLEITPPTVSGDPTAINSGIF